VNDDKDILVVDDDPDMVETIAMVLEASGYHCRTARNGREALAEAQAKRPAVVLLDMTMPVMNGWECARELRARYGHDVQVVAVTACEHIGARANTVDADYVLPKPFDIEMLKAVVARSVKRPDV